MKLPKCPVCNENVTKDQVPKRYKGKTYHIKCYDVMIGKKYEEEIVQQADPLKELREFIVQLFEIERMTHLMEDQLVKYTREYGYTASGMLNALKYYFEICENELNDKVKGIGIIPFVYKEANEFFQNLKQREEEAKGKDFSDSVKVKNIRIKPPENIPFFKLYDIDEI